MGEIERYLEELELAVPPAAEDAPSADIVREPAEPIGTAYCTWAAAELNRLFLELGATPHQAAKITAASILDGMLKSLGPTTMSRRPKKRPPDADSGARSCSLCRGPLGPQPRHGVFTPPPALAERLGKPRNAVVTVALCDACFARPDREAALERSILEEQEERATSADGSKLLRERRLR